MAAWTPAQETESFFPSRAADTAVNRLGIDGRPVPFLRGRIHEVAAIPFAVAGVTMAAVADSSLQRVAIAVFTVSVVAMLTASAAYHCHAYTFESKLSARRLDHAMIFVAIGGTQTAYWLLAAPPRVAITAIAIVWLVAAGGIHHKLTRMTMAHTSGSWLYIALGWTGVAMVPYLVGAGDLLAFVVVPGGGLVYTGGGFVLSHRLVDPWPKVFGYHEVWHLMVIIGVAAHFAGIVRLVAVAA
jgi:hemolysin III